jgi:hypothetical protein
MFFKNRASIPPNPLASFEIAALTARVPVSGSPTIDTIISTSLRYHTAVEFMAAIIRTGGHLSYDIAAREALAATDALLKRFQEGTTTSAEEEKT